MTSHDTALTEYMAERLDEIVVDVYAFVREDEFLAALISRERIRQDITRWFWRSYEKVMAVHAFFGEAGTERKTADDILGRLYQAAVEDYTTIELPREITRQK